MQLKKVLPGKVVSRKHKDRSKVNDSKLDVHTGEHNMSQLKDNTSAEKLSRDNSSKKRKIQLSNSRSSNRRQKQSNSND